jgi:hypothetical protein
VLGSSSTQSLIANVLADQQLSTLDVTLLDLNSTTDGGNPDVFYSTLNVTTAAQVAANKSPYQQTGTFNFADRVYSALVAPTSGYISSKQSFKKYFNLHYPANPILAI